MSDAVSFRLDEESRRALAQLEAAGMTRSEAIRYSLLKTARDQKRFDAIRQEVRRLDADGADQDEMRSIAKMMESIRATR